MAQTPVIVQARVAAADGRRAEGLALLETHLATVPTDVDARLVYGLILSWDGRYDDARRELGSVLAESPHYLDARVALMNVKFWSGHFDAAQELTTAILLTDAGNSQARLVRQRLDAKARPWSAGLDFTNDRFSDDRRAWLEAAARIGRETPVGAVIVRGSQADRFGLRDRQIEVEFYPRFRAGTYAFIGVGYSADRILYPEHRVSADLYQALAHGVEVSVGYRRLQFSASTDIYLATLSKYAGSWLMTGKTSYVSNATPGGSWSHHGELRRYLGALGTSFAGASYSHGLTREEPRGAGDLLQIAADTVRGQVEAHVTEQLILSANAGTSRQHSTRAAVWQTTVGAGLTVRF
ncbi:MAG TPA: YaiO family outer membrane beta-barrel protein [Gemmatimonadaceae bacterium]|nr:YaiO family outer membrane beta-barrel protein [Gemmatimonadaceae bacterium]